MRGKDLIDALVRRDLGITPACAGKRFSCKSGEKQVGDHPRVCGEKETLENDLQNAVGSPPRVRGKAISNGRLKDPDGITPAYAGKSLLCGR